MPDREIGDLVARFRLIVEENGTKEATAAINKLEDKLTAESAASGSAAGSAFSGAFSGSLAGQAILTGVQDLLAGAEASLKAFAEAGKAGALDPAAAKSYEEFNNATAEASQAVKELEIAVGTDLAPAIATAAQTITALAPLVSWFFKAVLQPVNDAVSVIHHFTGSADDAAAKTRDMAAAADEAAKREDALRKIIADEDKNLRSLVDAQVDVLEAELRVQGAQLSRTEALDAAQKAQQDYNDIVNRSGEVAAKQADLLHGVASAQQALTDAQFRAHRATESLADAQSALAEAQFRYGVQSSEAHKASQDLEDAQHNLSDANQAVDESQKSLADKQRDYKQALDDSGPSSAAAKDAAEKLARAQLGIKEADQAVVDSQDAYATKLAASSGITETAAQHAAEVEKNLRSMAAYAGSDEFASKLAAADAAIARITAGSSLAGADGGRGFQSQLDAAIGAAPAGGGGSISITVNAVGSTDQLVAQLKEEFDQANRALFLGYGGQRP